MSLEPGMTASFARARARGSQREQTTPARSEKCGRTALEKGDRCARKSRRILGGAARGTGLDNREGEFSAVGRRNHGAGLVALTSVSLSIYVLRQGAQAGHRTGLRSASIMGLFWAQESHFVPFCPIHFCLSGTCGTRLASRSAECRSVAVEIGFQEPQLGTRVVDGAQIVMAATAGCDSRNPCGVRTRDECTKRSGRSGWAVEEGEGGSRITIKIKIKIKSKSMIGRGRMWVAGDRNVDFTQ